jgi:hypothetical protein
VDLVFFFVHYFEGRVQPFLLLERATKKTACAIFCAGERKQKRPLARSFVQVNENKKDRLRDLLCFGARKKTRTSTMLPSLGPEPSASTNSAIRAI